MFQSSSAQSFDLYDCIDAVTDAGLVIEAGEVVKGIGAIRFGQCSCPAGTLNILTKPRTMAVRKVYSTIKAYASPTVTDPIRWPRREIGLQGAG